MSTAQDYQAAEQLLRRPARPGELVIGDKVRPQWIDGGARFWYAVSNGVGRRFVLVDPAAGTREPAFDHGAFKEVAFRTPIPAREVIRQAREHGVNPGYALGRDYEGMDDVLLVSVTEKKSVEDVDRLAAVLDEVCP